MAMPYNYHFSDTNKNLWGPYVKKEEKPNEQEKKTENQQSQSTKSKPKQQVQQDMYPAPICNKDGSPC